MLRFIVLCIFILFTGCSKTNEEVFKESLQGIGIYSQELFDYIDSDKDSKLSKDEFTDYRVKQDEFQDTHIVYSNYGNTSMEYNGTKLSHSLFEKADRDGDNSLSFKEFKGRFLSYRIGEYRPIANETRFSIYSSWDDNLTLDNIALKSHLFKEFHAEIHLIDKEKQKRSYWVKVELPKKMKSGKYRINFNYFTSMKYSLTQYQVTNSSGESIEFEYDTSRDSQVYYFRVDSFTFYPMVFIGQKIEASDVEEVVSDSIKRDYYSNPNIILLFSGLGIGLVLMAALYNTALFFNYRKKEFLYYTLMQLGMVLLLYSELNRHYAVLPRVDSFMVEYVGLFISLFATLFTQVFLETKKYLPKMHSIFNLYLLLIFVDVLWYADALIESNHLYSIFGVLFLVVAVMRIVHGYKIAWFYLIGWLFLIVATFLMEYYYSSFPFYTFFLGAGIEAMMLAWGLVYKMKVYRNE